MGKCEQFTMRVSWFLIQLSLLFSFSTAAYSADCKGGAAAILKANVDQAIALHDSAIEKALGDEWTKIGFAVKPYSSASRSYIEGVGYDYSDHWSGFYLSSEREVAMGYRESSHDILLDVYVKKDKLGSIREVKDMASEEADALARSTNTGPDVQFGGLSGPQDINNADLQGPETVLFGGSIADNVLAIPREQFRGLP